MKFSAHHPFPKRRSQAGTTGFTLTEIMVAMALFALVVFAAIYAQLFGMKMCNITQSKLSAASGARVVLNRVRDEIRAGKMLAVGNGSATGFTAIQTNAPIVGNALQIYPTTATNNYVRYYLDPDDQKLKRKTSDSTQIEVLASYITNQVVFAAEDYLGQTLTTDQNNRVIRMTLQFYQWEFPVASAGLGGYYDYYRLQTRITRRNIE